MKNHLNSAERGLLIYKLWHLQQVLNFCIILKCFRMFSVNYENVINDVYSDLNEIN